MIIPVCIKKCLLWKHFPGIFVRPRKSETRAINSSPLPGSAYESVLLLFIPLLFTAINIYSSRNTQMYVKLVLAPRLPLLSCLYQQVSIVPGSVLVCSSNSPLYMNSSLRSSLDLQRHRLCINKQHEQTMKRTTAVRKDYDYRYDRSHVPAVTLVVGLGNIIWCSSASTLHNSSTLRFLRALLKELWFVRLQELLVQKPSRPLLILVVLLFVILFCCCVNKGSWIVSLLLGSFFVRAIRLNRPV